MATTKQHARPRASTIDVSLPEGAFEGIRATTIAARAERMLAALGLVAELSISLVGDAAIMKLNRDYRKKNKPTDVLAFAMEEGAAVPSAKGARRMLGDVIVSIDTARRQAAERKRSLLAEVTMLLAHGILHLIGYDHRNDEEERVMVAKTRELERAAARATHRGSRVGIAEAGPSGGLSRVDAHERRASR